MSRAMAIEAVRECSGFTEEQSERLLKAAGVEVMFPGMFPEDRDSSLASNDLEAALDMLYEENNELVSELRAEGLPATMVPEFIPKSWHDDVPEDQTESA
eukprot:TRINITY_DN6932_c0_g1_i1.p1 TRINITY_DN6932_c0_g1~~TRINITY_DN6932_c0_g1_i1.p1  ORF type:complete len:100 (+),score=26.00 TRINITY_DN6932_c0_g1_i1:84-383(+)